MLFSEMTENVNTYDTFSYWFVPSSEVGDWDIYQIDDRNVESGEEVVCGRVHENKVVEFENGEAENELAQSDFERFRTRSEYALGKIYGRSNEQGEDTNLYDQLLEGCMKIRYFRKFHRDPDNRALMDAFHSCISWLKSTDFYEAPASTRYHESFKGGLLYHTLEVVNNVTRLMRVDQFKTYINLEDAILVALVHDWCKINLYESYFKNVKNEETGQWDKVEAFRLRKTPYTCFGHGVSSMILAQKFFDLSTAQCLAIRWHMGWCRVCDDEMNELQQANEMYPIVHLLQFADQLSITSY